MSCPNVRRRAPLPPGLAVLVLLLALVTVLLALSVAWPRAARADVTPMLNASVVTSLSRAGPVIDSKVLTPPTGPPDPWNGSVFSYASDPPNSAYGSMNISFSVTTAGMRVFSGGAGGVSDDGVHQGSATLTYFFISNTVQNANFSVTTALHDIPGDAGALLFPFEVQGNVPYTVLAPNWGTTSTTLRIPKGTWLVQAWAHYDSTGLTGTAPTFSVDANFVDNPTPLVTTQPSPQTVQSGQSANFSVTTSSLVLASAASGSTFQWRKNLVALSNGGHFSGVTTNHLTITGTALADSGYYDVVVTNGATVEGSSLAKLTVSSGAAGIGSDVPPNDVQLDFPVPNPAFAGTRVRFALPSPMVASLDVIDVAGRRVRTLVPATLAPAGARTVRWDGNTASGARAGAGVYLVRLRAGDRTIVRRLVSLAGN